MTTDTATIAPGTTWLAYVRDSGHENQAASCDQQERMVREVLAAAGAKLAREPFRDEARKGSSTVGRAGLEALLAVCARAGAADGVIFWSSARMAREVNDAQIIRATLRKRGYQLYFIADQVPQVGVWTPLLEVVQDIRNAQYLEGLSKEVKRGHAALLAAGYAPTGKPPAVGYRIEREQFGTHRDGAPRLGVRWVKDAAVRERVELAWAMRAQGSGYHAIHDATRLMQYLTSYGRLFANSIYKGLLRWGGVDYPGFVEPYVSADLWEQVQAIGRQRAATHPRTLGARFLLSGLLRCPRCGYRMGGKSNGVRNYPRQDGTLAHYRHDYYACMGFYEQHNGCRQRMLRCDAFDPQVIAAVMQVYHDPAALARLQAAEAEAEQGGALAAQLAEAESDVARHRAAIDNLLKLAKLGQFATVAGELAAVEMELKLAETRAAALQAQQYRARLLPVEDLQAFAARLEQALQRGDVATARLILARLVVRVEVKPDRSPHVVLRRVYA